MHEIPRNEHPRPQFARQSWMNLNGTWGFEIDNGRSGEARGLQAPGKALSGSILVPFCPESPLSGVEHRDFLYGVWYKRTVQLDAAALAGRVFLHFGAVDYEARVYVNGQPAGTHRGGYVSFALEVTALLHPGENEIAVFALDDTRSRHVPSGKQSPQYASFGCFYTRTTGIWQTVWLEFTPSAYLRLVQFYPNVAQGSVTVLAELEGRGDLRADIRFEGRPMGSFDQANASGTVSFTVPLAEKHLWEPGCGNLYDVTFTFGADRVDSYFGLRQVELDGMRFRINGKSVFQRLVLDQGFYPQGVYTAPTDEDLIGDIRMSMAAGFNGARLHEKVFEERFLYHADRMGYLLWGEYPSWGLDPSYPDSVFGILPEWQEEIRRDFNHPAIIGWCPYNETWDVDGRKQDDRVIRLVYETTKAMDPTRPCIDTSGNFHLKTDIFCIHDYEQDPQELRRRYMPLATGGKPYDSHSDRQTYGGEPCFLSEYGGIRWSEDNSGWGYGEGPKTEAEFIQRFRGLTDALLDNKGLFGLCYTQLTDVEQEQNGLYTYDRRAKFEPAVLHEILSRPAAIEQED